jgi:hypothetical protein
VTLAETLRQVIPDFPEALCQGTYDKFHPEPTASDEQIHELKSICASCPEYLKCRDYALDQRITGGVWGGLTEAERKSIWRKEGVGTREGVPYVASEDRLYEVVKLYEGGKTRTGIARELGIDFIQVQRVVELAKKRGLL